MNVQDIRRVLVMGAGIMGEGIAQNFAQAGLKVLLVDIDEGALGRCKRQIDANLVLLQECGLLQEDRPLVTSRIDAHRLRDTEDIDGIIDGIGYSFKGRRKNKTVHL